MRNVGGVPTSDFSAGTVRPFIFYRIDFPSPTPARRYTNKPGGFTGNIDGLGSFPWSEYAIDITAFSEGRDSTSNVTAIEIGNAGGEWYVLEASPGFADVPVDIWIGRFDSTATTLLGSYRRTRGVFGSYDLAETLQIEIVPEAAAWVTDVPIEMGAACSAPFKHPELCTYAGTDTTCLRTLADCTSKGNQAQFLGLALGIPPGTEISWDQFRKTVPRAPRPRT
jgi:hypothetical protein